LQELKSNKELRATARQYLRGNWGKPISAVIIYSFVTVLASIFFTVLKVGWLGDIFSFVISPPLIAGLLVFFLKLIRSEETSPKLVFSQFPRFDAFLLMYIIQVIFTILWTLLLIIPGIIAGFRYALSFFIMIDHPEMKGIDAIRRSKEMMYGYKWKYFLLHLSFIGWYLLCIPTLGIGLLWLTPYVFTTQASFYEDLRIKYEQKNLNKVDLE